MSSMYQPQRLADMEDTTSVSGGVTFAAAIIGLVGVLNVLDGILALTKGDLFVAHAQLLFSNLTTWGWIHLAFGVVQIVTAYFVLEGRSWARWTGVALAAVNAIVQLLFIHAYPWVALAAFSLDILVIWALTAPTKPPRAGYATMPAIGAMTSDAGRRPTIT
jgi:hypothetical protein